MANEIPSELQALLSNLLHDVDASGNLHARARRQVHELIEELSTPQHRNAAYYRRVKQAIACAFDALPKMKDRQEAYQHAKNLLDLVRDALAGQYPLEKLAASNERFHTEVEDLVDGSESGLVASYAGMAVYAAISTAVYDVQFDALGIEELELDPDKWEASFYCSLALSGSAPWEAKGGSELRREFWQRYLETIVPESWDIESPIGPVPRPNDESGG